MVGDVELRFQIAVELKVMAPPAGEIGGGGRENACLSAGFDGIQPGG